MCLWTVCWQSKGGIPYTIIWLSELKLVNILQYLTKFATNFVLKFVLTLMKTRQLQRGFAPDPLTRGFGPGPHWGQSPRTLVLGSRSALAVNSPPFQTNCPWIRPRSLYDDVALVAISANTRLNNRLWITLSPNCGNRRDEVFEVKLH